MTAFHRFENQVCPHCNSTGDQYVLFARATTERRHSHSGETKWFATKQLRAFVACSICEQPSMLTISPREVIDGRQLVQSSDSHERFLNRLSLVETLLEGMGHQKRTTYTVPGDLGGKRILNLYRIDAWHPTSAMTRPNFEDLPKEVNDALTELEGVMSQPRFAVIACRRVLEISCAQLLENPKPTLGERIRQLQGEGKLTKEATRWASALKDILNGKTHEGEAPTAETAKEVLDLTLFFVDILFVQPARIARMQKHPTPDTEESALSN